MNCLIKINYKSKGRKELGNVFIGPRKEEIGRYLKLHHS
jgi:hypothetical protein